MNDPTMNTAPRTARQDRQDLVSAALLVLERMGLSPADLAGAPQPVAAAPTFAEYVPIVAAAVGPGARRAYGSYWNRVVQRWGERRLDEPTPSEIRQLMAEVKANAVPREQVAAGFAPVFAELSPCPHEQVLMVFWMKVNSSVVICRAHTYLTAVHISK